jgi:hypothetical protein
MLGITMGAVIGTEVGKEPEPCIIGDIADIQAKVGGHFDCVRINVGSDPSADDMFTLVGYVHDEGRILNPPLEVNLMASMIFNQEIRGNCVILSGTNPETRAYDGENYDLPAVFYEFLCKQMTKDIEKSVSFTRMLSTSVGMAHRDKVINKDDYDYIIKTVNELGANGAIGCDVGSMPERCREIFEKCMQHMVTSVLGIIEED